MILEKSYTNSSNPKKLTFFVDMSIEYGLNIKCKRKFAWLLESRIMTPQVVQFVKENYKTISSEYEILFTHNKEIYELADNFIYLPPHGFWIEDPKIHPKSKLVSMISSNETHSTIVFLPNTVFSAQVVFPPL